MAPPLTGTIVQRNLRVDPLPDGSFQFKVIELWDELPTYNDYPLAPTYAYAFSLSFTMNPAPLASNDLNTFQCTYRISGQEYRLSGSGSNTNSNPFILRPVSVGPAVTLLMSGINYVCVGSDTVGTAGNTYTMPAVSQVDSRFEPTALDITNLFPYSVENPQPLGGAQAATAPATEVSYSAGPGQEGIVPQLQTKDEFFLGKPKLPAIPSHEGPPDAS